MRPDSDQRNQIDRGALRDLIHNATLGYLEYLPAHRSMAILLYQLLWGSRMSPGTAAAIVYGLRGDRMAVIGLREVVLGMRDGIRTFRRTRNIDVTERRASPPR